MKFCAPEAAVWCDATAQWRGKRDDATLPLLNADARRADGLGSEGDTAVKTAL